MNKSNSIKPVFMADVDIKDKFWSYYTELVRNVVIPYQWDALNDRIPDTEPSYSVKNFKIAAGLEQGEFKGCVFQDSDLAKWLEAVGYSLQKSPDAELERTADEMIDIIEKAQDPDGYLDTYFSIKCPDKKWTNLYQCHELYCAGHMMEAAVAYYKATGKRKLLDVMCRVADHIDSVFGTEPGKLKGYPGHPEVELALVKLYKATGNERYLKLSKFFIDERGSQPSYFTSEWEEKRDRKSFWNLQPCPSPDLAYNQSHMPVRSQEEAVGHAVRAVYLYSGMADIAIETGDAELLEACGKIWNNIISKRMYITGGIGSTHHGEAFTFDYDLPNDTVYAETCASIGLIYFAWRMQQADMSSVYSDVIEKILYNIIPGSISRDGRSFFYVNPLEVLPEASVKDPGKRHVKALRQKWFGCACCPPNIARLLASLGDYIYSAGENTVYTHLYIGSRTEVKLQAGKIGIAQETCYPWDEKISIRVSCVQPAVFSAALRIPGWCRKWKVTVNGKDVNSYTKRSNGYLFVERLWTDGDTIEMVFDMPVELMEANPEVRADAGKVALQRGPVVYCLEEIDNGSNLSAISLLPDTCFKANYEKDMLDGITVIRGKTCRTSENDWKAGMLYRPVKPETVSVDITAIPYYAWGNRGKGEMQVWTRYRG